MDKIIGIVILLFVVILFAALIMALFSLPMNKVSESKSCNTIYSTKDFLKDNNIIDLASGVDNKTVHKDNPKIAQSNMEIKRIYTITNKGYYIGSKNIIDKYVIVINRKKYKWLSETMYNKYNIGQILNDNEFEVFKTIKYPIEVQNTNNDDDEGNFFVPIPHGAVGIW